MYFFFLSRSVGTTLSRQETLDNVTYLTAGLKYRQLNTSDEVFVP